MNLETKINSLLEIAKRFQRSGVAFTLGGSCLLFAHKLVDNFQDLDLLTEEPEDRILMALKGLELRKVGPSGVFTSDYFYKFSYGGADFDLMGNFHIYSSSEKIKIQSIGVGFWKGIPLGSLQVWKKAYELMDRQDKAQLIQL